MEAFIEGERVSEFCDAIEVAIEQGDPGKIDLVLERLEELEPD